MHTDREHLAPLELRADVERRLAVVAGVFTPEEFRALVDRVVSTTLRYREPAPHAERERMTRGD